MAEIQEHEWQISVFGGEMVLRHNCGWEGKLGFSTNEGELEDLVDKHEHADHGEDHPVSPSQVEGPVTVRCEQGYADCDRTDNHVHGEEGEVIETPRFGDLPRDLDIDYIHREGSVVPDEVEERGFPALWVGKPVHYVSYGTPGGEFTSKCRAAVVADFITGEDGRAASDVVQLVVLNPQGTFYNSAPYDAEHGGGSWHDIC